MGNPSKFLVTMQYEENHLLPVLLNHYSRYFEPNNIFVIDHGSSQNLVPPGFNRIYVPRDRPFSEAVRLEFIRHLCFGLLKYYDIGVYVDCDELIALDNFDYNVLNQQPVLFVAGFEGFFSSGEGKKRLLGIVNPEECKPLIFSAVPSWIPGFHTSIVHSPFPVLRTPMVHSRFLFKEATQARIGQRIQVYEQIAANEKQHGVDLHWLNAQSEVDNFYSYIEKLLASKPVIAPFTDIKRDRFFERDDHSPQSGISAPFHYNCKGKYFDYSKIYDLSKHFPNLLET